LQQLTGSESLATGGALGWAGDRFAVFDASGAYAVVWWSAWDDAQAAARFAAVLSRSWGERRPAPGRRWTVEQEGLRGRPLVRLIDAPEGWPGWRRPPSVQLE
jgi:hypothetical protein